MAQRKFDEKSGMVLAFGEFHALRGDDGASGHRNTSEWDSLPEVKNAYDSEAETRKHIARVNEMLLSCIVEITRRANAHDLSKLSIAEKPYFDKETPILAELTFGSDEWRDSIARLKPALDHHYAHNSHHPQHYENGIEGMDLFDLIEMLCDWKAAGERDKGGDILASITINTGRFDISDQLAAIFVNHAKRYFI